MLVRHVVRSFMSAAQTNRRVASFVAVGCLAAGVHWAVVVLAVEGGAWSPLVANVLGWAVAFVVSFGGHHHSTFRGHGVPLGVAARRFFAISLGGFAINEAAYALLLHWTGGRRYELLLAIVLAAVAVLTFAASRHWAFLRTEA